MPMTGIDMTERTAPLIAEKFHVSTEYASRLATAAIDGIDARRQPRRQSSNARYLPIRPALIGWASRSVSLLRVKS